MLELLKIILIAMLPPIAATPEQLFIHRVITTIGIFAMAISTGALAAISFGFFTWLFPGFASAQELNTLATIQKTMLAQQLDADIFQTRKSQCETESADAKALYAERLQQKLGEYWVLKQYRPRVPGCDEFGVTVARTGH